jgi:hypothetical protein
VYLEEGVSMKVGGPSAVAIWLTLLVVVSSVFLPGCGADPGKQDFADSCLEVLSKLESRPDISQKAREAGIAYMNSGYSDLESAEQAMKAYQESRDNDREALELLDEIKEPDRQAREISRLLREGIEKIETGKVVLADNLSRAGQQSADERARSAMDVGTAMSFSVEGMSSIVDSMGKLLDYASANNLDNQADVEEWKERVESELETVKGYLNI